MHGQQNIKCLVRCTIFLQVGENDLLKKRQFYNNPLSDPKILLVHNVYCFSHGNDEVCIIGLFKYVHSLRHRIVQQAHKILRMKMSAALPKVKPNT